MIAPPNQEKLDHVCTEAYGDFGDLGIPQFTHPTHIYIYLHTYTHTIFLCVYKYIHTYMYM